MQLTNLRISNYIYFNTRTCKFYIQWLAFHVFIAKNRLEQKSSKDWMNNALLFMPCFQSLYCISCLWLTRLIKKSIKETHANLHIVKWTCSSSTRNALISPKYSFMYYILGCKTHSTHVSPVSFFYAHNHFNYQNGLYSKKWPSCQ